MNNSTIKEYYIKIQELYANAVNILTAINQSFQTSSSEITVNITDTDDVQQTLRIPSFLYLENKLEQLDSNLNNLFKMPKSGEAWFSKSSDMYKLELVKSNNAPIKPILSDEKLKAFTKNTYIFKDLVNPKTYLKLGIDNLPDNISQMIVKKMVFFDYSLYDLIKQNHPTTYDEYKALLYTLNEGIDYEEYDTVIDLPIKKDQFISEFRIIDIPQGEVENPYIDYNTNNLIYKVIFDTLIYRDEDDSSIEYSLQPGQYLCLDNEYVIYKILSVNTIIENDMKQHEVVLEELSGHIGLQSFEDNSGMIMHIYNKDYSKYHYVELPLEENPYVAFFIGTLYNNTKSVFSDALLLDLNNIMMVNSDGTPLLVNNQEISYIDYYNEFCINVGDMLLGISSIAYPQLSNYNNAQLNELENGDAIKSEVSETLSKSSLKVQRINSHLINDDYTTKIINLHSKRNELNSDIFAIQQNIDNIYNQLVTTDFLNSHTITQISLKKQLDELYEQRITLQKEFISIVENINVLKNHVASSNNSKFRIRGVIQTNNLEAYIKDIYPKCEIIKMDVEYKYKSVNLDTTSLQNIDNNVFTDWNKLASIERDRKLVFSTLNNSYKIDFENYDNLNNIIKWNQIDIPIQQGEDVILRVRFQYNIGQPFLNMYSPWSDDITVSFPIELLNTTEVDSILETNKDDTINARFEKTLLNDGYQEHIANKIIDNSQVYFHMPENIYSGFNTPENKFISLKDKLQSLTNDINQYKELILSDIDSQYSIYLSYDDKVIELNPNIDNIINITENNLEINDTYITKTMNLVIKNVGNSPLKIYSIFPGNSDKYLIQFSDEEEKIYNSSKYERVPILIEGDGPFGLKPDESVAYQSCGQWIYFKETGIYNTANYYIDYLEKNISLVKNIIQEWKKGNKVKSKIPISYDLMDYLNTNKQPLLPYRLRNKDIINGYNNMFISTVLHINTKTQTYEVDENNLTSNNILDFYNSIVDDFNTEYQYDYKDYLSNEFILRYEHILGISNTNSTLMQLSNKKSLNVILENKFKYYDSSEGGLKDINASNLIGGFLIPTLNNKNQILCKEKNNSYIIINENDTISIPITFQYYLQDASQTVEKYLSFDIKKSLLKDPENYILKIIAKYDFSNNSVYDTYTNTIQIGDTITS